jgi:hypothetical protein
VGAMRVLEATHFIMRLMRIAVVSSHRGIQLGSVDRSAGRFVDGIAFRWVRHWLSDELEILAPNLERAEMLPSFELHDPSDHIRQMREALARYRVG